MVLKYRELRILKILILLKQFSFVMHRTEQFRDRYKVLFVWIRILGENVLYFVKEKKKFFFKKSFSRQVKKQKNPTKYEMLSNENYKYNTKIKLTNNPQVLYI